MSSACQPSASWNAWPNPSTGIPTKGRWVPSGPSLMSKIRDTREDDDDNHKTQRTWRNRQHAARRTSESRAARRGAHRYQAGMGESDREHEGPNGQSGVERAEADGRLRPGGTVVEYTAGATGISLAFV